MYPLRDFHAFTLACHPAPSTTKTTLFFGPTFQCWAKYFKTRSKSWLLTNGSIHQYVSPELGCTKPYNHSHWNRQLTWAVALLNSSTHSRLKTGFNPIRCSSIDHTSTSLEGFGFLIFLTNWPSFFFPFLQVLRISDSWCSGRGTLNRNFMGLRYSHPMQTTDFLTLEFTHPIGKCTTLPQPAIWGWLLSDLPQPSLVPHHSAEGHDRYFGNADLRGILVLNGCNPRLIHKSNRDYNLSLPSLLR